MTVYLKGKNGKLDIVEKNVAVIKVEDTPTGDEVIVICGVKYPKKDYDLVKVESR